MAVKSKAPTAPAKTPSAPSKRSKSSAALSTPAPAPAKAATKRGAAAKRPKAQEAPMHDASIDQGGQQQTFEAPPELVDQQPTAAEASGADDDRAGRALEAIKTLGEMIAEGIGALAQLRAEMRDVSGRLDQIAAGMQRPGDSDSYPVGRDHDPGDAVPPGVAVMSPTPITETDEAALHSLEELPKRTGRGKRTPRPKA